MGAWNFVPTVPALTKLFAPTFKIVTDLAAVTAETYYVRKINDQTVVNNTLVNDNDLVLPVVATAEYEVRAQLFYSSGTTPDLKLGWTVPSGATITWGVVSNNVAFLKATTVTIAIQTDNSSGDEHAIIEGVLTVGVTPGNLQLQWAQNTTSGSTIMRGNSTLRLTRVA